MIEITSSKNPTIKEIKSLSNKKYRWANSLYIIEGIKIVEEALNNNIFLKYIVVTDEFLLSNSANELCQKILSHKNLIKIDTKIFSDLSDTINSQGIIAVAEIKNHDLSQVIHKKNNVLLFLDNVQDPGNMGTIIRTVDAFNMNGIILNQGCVDPYNLKVVRATMGSIFRVPLYFCKDNLYALDILRTNNYSIYATSLEGSLPIFDVTYDKNIVLVIGNESNGVSDEVLNAADNLIKIPMPGKSESLNAGVAASILMYEIMRQGLKGVEF